MEQLPHLLIEGMLIGAFSLKVYRGYIFLRGEYIEAAKHLRKAIEEAKAAGLLGIAKRLNFDDIIYMSYSIDFRRKVIFTMEEEGLSIREIAKQFWIGSGSVSRWINQIEPKASSTRQRKIDPKRACRAFWRLSEGHLASS